MGSLGGITGRDHWGSGFYYGQVGFTMGTMAKWTLLWPRMGQVDFTMAEPAPDSQTQLKNRPRRAGIFRGALKGPITPKNVFSWFWPRWTLLWPRIRCFGGWLRAVVPQNAHPCFAEFTHWLGRGRAKIAKCNQNKSKSTRTTENR